MEDHLADLVRITVDGTARGHGVSAAAEDGTDLAAADLLCCTDGNTAAAVILLADGDVDDTALTATGKPGEIVQIVLYRAGALQHVVRDRRDRDLPVPEKAHPGIDHALETDAEKPCGKSPC